MVLRSRFDEETLPLQVHETLERVGLERDGFAVHWFASCEMAGFSKLDAKHVESIYQPT